MAPELTGLGRLVMHSVPHHDRLPLDGTWRFQLLSGPEARTSRKWTQVEVPGCWTMQGVGDHPQYTNVQMPYPGEAPAIPDADPTGLYERSFEVPEDWAGRRIVLHVGAAESVLIVRLNGTEVGVSKDSHLAAEFDVTDHVRAGANTLVLRVVKWSDANYVEDQDQWWHGGITRSVYLYATEPVYLADVRAIAGLADDLRTGTLDLQVQVAFGPDGPQPGWTVEARVDGLDEGLKADVPTPALREAGRYFAEAEADLMSRRAAGTWLEESDREAWKDLEAWLAPTPVGCRELDARGATGRALVGRDAQPCSRHRRSPRRRGHPRRGGDPARRIPTGRGEGSRPPHQRSTGLHQGRQSPRLRPAHRARHLASTRCVPIWSR